MRRLVILLAQTHWLMLIANQKLGQSDLVYWGHLAYIAVLPDISIGVKSKAREKLKMVYKYIVRVA